MCVFSVIVSVLMYGSSSLVPLPLFFKTIINQSVSPTFHLWEAVTISELYEFNLVHMLFGANNVKCNKALNK